MQVLLSPRIGISRETKDAQAVLALNTHKGKIANDIANDRTLTRANRRNRVVRDPDLEKGDDPNDRYKDEKKERANLKFDIITQINEAKRNSEHKSDLIWATV
jgi:hypothetical protein